MNSMFNMELDNDSRSRLNKVANFNKVALEQPEFKKYVPEWYDPQKVMEKKVKKFMDIYKGDAETSDPLFNYIHKTRFAVGNAKRNFLAIPPNELSGRFYTTKRELVNSNHRILGLHTCKDKDKDPEIWNKHLSNFKELNLRYFDVKEYIDFYHIGIAYNPENKLFYLLINSEIDSDKYPTQITNLIENKYSEVMEVN